MAAHVHTGDVGTVFRLTVKDQDGAVVDISTASSKRVQFKKPDFSTVDQAGAFTNTGTDGQLQYTTTTGDITQAGNWSVWAKVVIGTSTFYSDALTFTVVKVGQ